MPTQIVFSEGNQVEVEEDPEFVSAALTSAEGSLERVVLTRRGENGKVYVNAAAIAYHELAPERRNKPRLNTREATGGSGT